MTVLPVTRPLRRVDRPDAGHSRRTELAVPESGVLHFPGVGADVAPPAQLGPMMTPPGRATLFGR